MATPIGQDRGRAFRWAGYLLLLVAVLSSLDWLATIRRDYVMEHHWPAASGTIYSLTEESREVEPPSVRQRRYKVYWAEFNVALDLPPDRCPGDLMVLGSQQEECHGAARSPASKSPGAAFRWLGRHPVNSRVTVHYDLQERKLWIAGESVADLYPWDKILATIVLLALSAVLFFIARKLSLADATDGPGSDKDRSMVALDI